MQCYIISFQTSSIANRENLEEAIRSYGTWARITSDTWAVVSNNTAKDIRDHLLSFLNQGDRLIVVRSGTAAAWSNIIASSNWLKKYL